MVAWRPHDLRATVPHDCRPRPGALALSGHAGGHQPPHRPTDWAAPAALAARRHDRLRGGRRSLARNSASLAPIISCAAPDIAVAAGTGAGGRVDLVRTDRHA